LAIATDAKERDWRRNFERSKSPTIAILIYEIPLPLPPGRNLRSDHRRRIGHPILEAPLKHRLLKAMFADGRDGIPLKIDIDRHRLTALVNRAGREVEAAHNPTEAAYAHGVIAAIEYLTDKKHENPFAKVHRKKKNRAD
jgi:hypothetical protein